MKSLACLLLMVSLSAGAQDCPPDDPAKRDTAAQVAYVLQWGPIVVYCNAPIVTPGDMAECVWPLPAGDNVIYCRMMDNGPACLFEPWRRDVL